MTRPAMRCSSNNVTRIILPIESVLTPVEVEAIVGKYDPRVVIPSHYSLHGLTTEVSGLDSADRWVKDQEKVHSAHVRRLDRAELTLNKAELKRSHHRVYYFGNHFEQKQTLNAGLHLDRTIPSPP